MSTSTTPQRPALSLDLLSRLSRTHRKYAHGAAGAVSATAPGPACPDPAGPGTTASDARPGRPGAVPGVRLDIPPSLGTSLGCDAVGVPARFATRLMHRLPRVGCVFADATHWWWIVPAGSDIETSWPAPARYASGARVPLGPSGPVSAQRRPVIRLVHRPDGDSASAYTPPLPLYFMVCQLTGTTPTWSAR